MGNQQPSTLEERLLFLAKNARFGDGYLWKHPKSKNYKMIFASTTPELLNIKYNIVPEIFSSGIYLVTNRQGIYPNAKPLYNLASKTHPIITKVATMPLADLISTLTIDDFALWYLDDGSMLKRHEYKNKEYYRFILSIGNICATPENEEVFKKKLKELFGDTFGRITKNNSKATERNKIWVIPKPIALQILAVAKQRYNVLPYKFPPSEGSTTIRLAE